MRNYENDPNAMQVLKAAEKIINDAAMPRWEKIIILLGQHVAAAAYLTTGIPRAPFDSEKHT